MRLGQTVANAGGMGVCQAKGANFLLIDEQHLQTAEIARDHGLVHFLSRLFRLLAFALVQIDLRERIIDQKIIGLQPQRFFAECLRFGQ